MDGDSAVTRLKNVLTRSRRAHIVIIWLQVNYNVTFSNSDEHLKILHRNLKQSLHLKWLNTPEKIVGLKLECNSAEISLSQQFLINQLLLKHDRNYNQQHIATYTPLTDTSLVTSTDRPDNTSYQSYIGLMNYLVFGTHPDISHSINYLACYSSNPNQLHWTALHHLLRYIRTTKHKKL